MNEKKIYKHSIQIKQKLSEIRKNYLQTHPDKRAWQTHEYGKSVPCEQLKELLRNNNIEFIAEYEPLLHKNRFFSIDIAFPHIKVGVEINGRQHYDSNGNLTPYYQERHNLIEADGWKLYEIPYNMAFKHERMLADIKTLLTTTSKINFEYKLYIPRKRKEYISIRPNNIKYNYPKDDLLKEMATTMKLQDLSIKLNIPKKALWYHLNKRDILTKRHIKKLYPSDLDPNWRHRAKLMLRKVERPSKEILELLIQDIPLTHIGLKYGVSDNTIRKWCKYNGIVL